MKYIVWCTKHYDIDIEADNVDEAIAKAKDLCPFYPDVIEIEIAEEESEEEE